MSETFDRDHLSDQLLAPMTREGETVCADWVPSAAFPEIQLVYVGMTTMLLAFPLRVWREKTR